MRSRDLVPSEVRQERGPAAAPPAGRTAWSSREFASERILLAAGVGEAFAGVSVVVAVGIGCLLSRADARRLRASGHDVPTAPAVLLVPAYLFARARRTGQESAVPVVWCVCFAASFAGAAIVGNTGGVATDVPEVEADIVRGVEEQAGVGGVAVECPDSVSPRPGAGFQCIADARSERVSVEVTVQNTAGEFLGGSVPERLVRAPSDPLSRARQVPCRPRIEYDGSRAQPRREDERRLSR